LTDTLLQQREKYIRFVCAFLGDSSVQHIFFLTWSEWHPEASNSLRRGFPV